MTVITHWRGNIFVMVYLLFIYPGIIYPPRTDIWQILKSLT